MVLLLIGVDVVGPGRGAPPCFRCGGGSSSSFIITSADAPTLGGSAAEVPDPFFIFQPPFGRFFFGVSAVATCVTGRYLVPTAEHPCTVQYSSVAEKTVQVANASVTKPSSLPVAWWGIGYEGFSSLRDLSFPFLRPALNYRT